MSERLRKGFGSFGPRDGDDVPGKDLSRTDVAGERSPPSWQTGLGGAQAAELGARGGHPSAEVPSGYTLSDCTSDGSTLDCPGSGCLVNESVNTSPAAAPEQGGGPRGYSLSG